MRRTRPLAAAIFALMASAGAAHANGEVLAARHYEISLAGIGVGDASLTVEEIDGRYRAAIVGAYGFLLWTGEIDAVAEGDRRDLVHRPRAYRSVSGGSSQIFRTRIDFDAGGVTEYVWNAEPPLKRVAMEDRVPVTKAQLRGAVDPISGLMIGARSAAEACTRTLALFTGVARFDIALSPDARITDRPGEISCATAYRPISGHRAKSDLVKRLSKGGISVALSELAPDLWAPSRVTLQTPVGTLEIVER